MLQGQSHEYATFLARLLNYVKSFQYQARRENPCQIRHSSHTGFEMILFVDNCILNSFSFCKSLKYILFFSELQLYKFLQIYRQAIEFLFGLFRSYTKKVQ